MINKIIDFINRINEKIGIAISWLTTGLVLLVSYDVFSRYLLEESLVAIQELEWHIFAVLFLISAAYTFKHDKHVRVDIIYSKLSKNKKSIINIIGILLFLVPFCFLIVYSSKDFVINSISIGESSPNPGGLPARYLLKFMIPVSFLLLLFQGIVILFQNIQEIKKYRVVSE